MEQQIYIISATLVVYILFFVGALGSFLPILPGPLLAGVGLLAFKVLVPAASISWWLVGVGVAFAVIAQFLDLVTTWIGAKKFGATWRGALGRLSAFFVGIFLPPRLFDIYSAFGFRIPVRVVRRGYCKGVGKGGRRRVRRAMAASV